MLRSYFHTMSTAVRCVYLSALVLGLCAFLVFGPQRQAEVTLVADAPHVSSASWHRDPYVRIRLNNLDTFDVQIDEITDRGPVHLSYQFVSWPTVEANDPIGDRLFVIRVLHDSTDLANHVENFFVDEVMANDPRATLRYTVKTGQSTWITTVGVAATKQIALMDLPNIAQSELHLQGTLSTDSSAFHYDSVTVKVNGVELARVDASYSRPMLHMPAACLKGDEAANADYIVIFGNNVGYIVVAKSFEFKGKIDPDIQLCWLNDQESALKALHQIADEHAGMARGNWVTWHEGTKAYVAMAEFRSLPAPHNNNQ